MKNFLILFLLISCSGVQLKSEPNEIKPELLEVKSAQVAINPIESRFEIVRELPYFKEVVKVADCVMNLKDFQDEISKIESFGNTKETGEQVKNTMLLPIKAKLRYYKNPNPWSSVTAYTVKDEVYFNSRKTRSLASNVNTAIHERIHVLGYKHVSSKNIGRDIDNAYMIGNMAEKYVGKCK